MSSRAPALPTTAEELLASITDPTEPSKPNFWERAVDHWAQPKLMHKKDLAFPRLLARFITQVLPLAVALYLVPPAWAWALSVPYAAYILARFAGPVILGLHAVTHRPLFKKRYRWIDRIFTHVMPPFWGLPPFAYKAHHVMMHHSENNGDDDLSGTAEYRRDSPLHFVHYWWRFFAFGYLHMISWMVRRERKGSWLVIVGDTLVVAAVVGLAFWNLAATFAVFILPFVSMRFLLMSGNWTEHAFVDVDAPTNSYRNSTCLLNTPYNHMCYNAGYHAIHHIAAGRHWSDMPRLLEKYLPKFIEEDTILFYGVNDQHVIWWKLMVGDYDYLAERLLDLGGRRPTHEEKVAFLKARVQTQRGTMKGLLERREAAAAAG